MKQQLLIFTLINFLVLGGKIYADESGDVDADVEESISDSEAAKAHAREMQDVKAKEHEQTAALRKQEEKAKAEADAKKESAKAELTKLDKEITALQNEQRTLKGKLEKHARDISYSETTLANHQAKNEKKKAELAALNTLKAEKVAKIAELDKKNKETTDATAALVTQMTQAKADLAKTTADEKAAQKRLQDAQKEQAAQKAKVAAAVAGLKAQFKTNTDKINAVEAEIRKLRQNTAKSDEETKMAESEVASSDARLKEAQERLNDVKQRTSAKEAELNSRKTSADAKLHSASRESAEANLKVDQAAADQSANRALAAADKTEVNVQLKSAAPASVAAGDVPVVPPIDKMTVNRDCRVFSKPDGKSDVLGLKKTGTFVRHATLKTNWVSFPLSQGRTGWIAKVCLDQN